MQRPSEFAIQNSSGSFSITESAHLRFTIARETIYHSLSTISILTVVCRFIFIRQIFIARMTETSRNGYLLLSLFISLRLVFVLTQNVNCLLKHIFFIPSRSLHSSNVRLHNCFFFQMTLTCDRASGYFNVPSAVIISVSNIFLRDNFSKRVYIAVHPSLD